ncbi:MAG: DNA mismatch endonuclease Vsr [Acidobacteria bacterium]|nr:DNA mismatch endonuclease Vsr [Acidobacteriota bacterium]
MRRIRSKNTLPKKAVRGLIHRLGVRFRIHCSTLPGCPDLVFPSRRKVIFVHGCFWHQHRGCRNCHFPKSRLDYWQPKLERNKFRDRKNRAVLKSLGWKSLVLWECQVKRQQFLAETVSQFLGDLAVCEPQKS